MGILEMIHNCCTCNTVDRSSEFIPSNGVDVKTSLVHNDMYFSAKNSSKNNITHTNSVRTSSPSRSTRRKKSMLEDNQKLRETVKEFASQAIKGIKVIGVDLRTKEKFPIIYSINKKLQQIFFYDYEYKNSAPLSFDIIHIEDSFGSEDSYKFNQAIQSVGLSLGAEEKERCCFIQFKNDQDQNNTSSNVVLLIEDSVEKKKNLITSIKVLKLYAKAILDSKKKGGKPGEKLPVL